MALIPKTRENAVLLLAAAEKLGLPSRVVRSTTKGFTAPDEVVAEAALQEKPRLDAVDGSLAADDGSENTDPPEPPVESEPQSKKATAKKAAAKGKE